MLYLMILSSVIIGVAGQLLMKHGVSQLGVTPEETINFFLEAAKSPWIVGGIFGYGLGTLIWLMILSKVDVSFAYPMLALGYVFVLLFSSLFLGEKITSIRITGVILIVVGVILVTRS